MNKKTSGQIKKERRHKEKNRGKRGFQSALTDDRYRWKDWRQSDGVKSKVVKYTLSPEELAKYK